ncbi:MAG: DUF368 domain-containing protein [Chlamydiota bacterium]
MVKNRPSSFRAWLGLALRGFFMGLADMVPGVSGGTVAFISGIYEDLIESVKSFNIQALKELLGLRFHQFKKTVAWEFLSALASGMMVAVVFLAPLFHFLLNHELYRSFLYSGFLGLILASIFFCVKQVKEWKVANVIVLTMALLSAYYVCGLQLGEDSGGELYAVAASIDVPQDLSISNYHDGKIWDVAPSTLEAMTAKGLLTKDTLVFSQQQKMDITLGEVVTISGTAPKIDWWIFFCGMLGVSAMLLPGISGSYILNILGAYTVVIGALAEFSRSLSKGSIDGDAFVILATLFMGVIVGGMLFSRVISWLFARYHNLAIAALIGFMLGALRAVWPFWSVGYFVDPLKPAARLTLKPIQPLFPEIFSWTFGISVAIFLGGLFSVFFLELLASKKKQPTLDVE